MKIIDFHTHAFPDSLAAHAMAALQAETDEVIARSDGTIGALLKSMDSAAISSSVICSIATKPEQFDPILKWSKSIQSERIIPFPSIHPADSNPSEKMHIVAEEGFKGIKLHPYYQDFFLDDESIFPLYEAACKNNLMIVSHTGFDIAFPRIRRCDPVRINSVCSRFPELLFIATHLGSWEDWDEVEKYLVGNEVYMECSFAVGYLEDERIRNVFEKHPKEFLLFGTDSPWMDQAESVERIDALCPDKSVREALFYNNASRLLGF